MSAHTPGPWEAWQEREPHGPWQVTMGEAGELYIGFMPDGSPDEANARLIAAAPDLLAALREVADLQGGAHAPVGSLWSRVNVAISKATGVVDLGEPDARQLEIARARALYDKCDKP